MHEVDVAEMMLTSPGPHPILSNPIPTRSINVYPILSYAFRFEGKTCGTSSSLHCWLDDCYVPLAIIDLVQATDPAPWVQTTMESFEDLIPATDAAAATVLPRANLRLAERRLEAEW